jgi:penicillin-binding protein 1A
MRQEGWITPGQETTAIAGAAPARPAPGGEGDFGYVLDLAAAQARELAPKPGADGYAPDLRVQLTVDPRLQSAATRIVASAMRGGRRRVGAEQAALVALAPDGSIRALVGGADHRASPYNRAVQARRQPGSAYKPFVWAAALEQGVAPADIREDAPVRFGDYAPENYGGGYAGAVTVAEALAKSRNTVAGPPRRRGRARQPRPHGPPLRLHHHPEKPPLSVALGTKEVTLLELTGAYQTFQLGGRRPSRVTLIEEITTARGDLVYRRVNSAAVPAYDRADNAQMIRMLKGVIEYGTGTRAAFGRPAAGKTGTSQNWRDAWFVGFTPDWVAGVWVGNDDDRPTAKITGGELPASIWRRFMIEAHQGVPVRDFDGQAPERRALEARDAFYAELAAEFAREAETAAP